MREAAATRHGRRRRHRLPARHARAAHRARPRARRRSRRLGRGRRDHAQRAGRRRARRQVHARAAGASTCALRLLAGAALAPGGPRRGCACAPRDGALVPLSALVHAGGAAGAAGDHAPRPRARHHRLRQRRARALAGRGARATSSSSARTLPPGYRVGARRRERGVPASRCGSLCSRSSLGIIVAYMVLASQFNSFLHPVTVLTILPLSVAGAVVRALVRRQDAEHLQHDRPPAADGHREEELDHPGRLRQPAARSKGTSARDAMLRGRPGAPAADPDDLDRDADGRAAAPRWRSARARRCARRWRSR